MQYYNHVPATVGAGYAYGLVSQPGTESKRDVYSVHNGSARAHGNRVLPCRAAAAESGYDDAAANVEVRTQVLTQSSVDQAYSVPYAAGEEGGESASGTHFCSPIPYEGQGRTSVFNNAVILGNAVYSSEQGADA